MTNEEAISLVHLCMHVNNERILKAREMAMDALKNAKNNYESAMKITDELRKAYIKGEHDGIEKSNKFIEQKIRNICEQLRIKITDSENCPKFERAFRQVALEEALNIVIMEMNI